MGQTQKLVEDTPTISPQSLRYQQQFGYITRGYSGEKSRSGDAQFLRGVGLRRRTKQQQKLDKKSRMPADEGPSCGIGKMENKEREEGSGCEGEDPK